MTLAFDLPPAADSCLSRMDPRCKLAALVPAAVLVALVRTVPAAAAALLAALLLAEAARLPRGWLVRRLAWTALLIALFLVWLLFLPDPNGVVYHVAGVNISQTGLERFGAVTLKTLAVVTLMLIVLATAPLHDGQHHLPSAWIHPGCGGPTTPQEAQRRLVHGHGCEPPPEIAALAFALPGD